MLFPAFVWTAKSVAELKTFANQIAVYTVNDPAWAQQLFDWGVSAVFSDHANLLQAL